MNNPAVAMSQVACSTVPTTVNGRPASTKSSPSSSSTSASSVTASPGPSGNLPEVSLVPGSSPFDPTTITPAGAPSTETALGVRKIGRASKPESIRSSVRPGGSGVLEVIGPDEPSATTKRSPPNTSSNRSLRSRKPSEKALSSSVIASTRAMPSPITRNRCSRARKSGHATIQTNPHFGIPPPQNCARPELYPACCRRTELRRASVSGCAPDTMVR